MEGNVPSSAAAHYEARQQDALGIDLVAALEFGHRLEQARFADQRQTMVFKQP